MNIITLRWYLVWAGLLLAATNWCTTLGAAPLFVTQIVIHAEHSGWGFLSTNLTLRLTNGVYTSGTYTVAPAVISNLMAAARAPGHDRPRTPGQVSQLTR